MKKSLFTLLFGSIFSTVALSQQGLPFYNHYLVSDKMLINPSYAGQNQDYLTINGTHRNQWDDLPNSPSTQTVSAHANVIDRLAIGTYFFNDRNGAVKLTGFNLTAAYHIPIEDNYRNDEQESVFSFGVGVSNIGQRIDLNALTNYDQGDPLLDETKYNATFLNLGLSLNYRNFNLGFSILDVNLGENKYFINNVEPLPTWFYVNLGYNWYVSEGIRLEPSLVYNQNSNSDRHLDFNLLGHFGFGENDQGIAVGIGYKQGIDKNGSQPLFVSPILKAKIGSIKAGISYDIGLSDFQADGRKNGMLFSLGFDLANPFGEYRY